MHVSTDSTSIWSPSRCGRAANLRLELQAPKRFGGNSNPNYGGKDSTRLSGTHESSCRNRSTHLLRVMNEKAKFLGFSANFMPLRLPAAVERFAGLHQV